MCMFALLPLSIAAGNSKPTDKHRSTQWRKPQKLDDEDALTAAIIELASKYGRYGYRRITALRRRDGWHVNHKRVARIWRRGGLRVPQVAQRRRSAEGFG